MYALWEAFSQRKPNRLITYIYAMAIGNGDPTTLTLFTNYLSSGGVEPYQLPIQHCLLILLGN